ncbi:unnamed protein product [Moneuplotes crassus]|uniref:Uncharacterized protein n=1 Tax=Euplotes crassus TaxID=5936 RepID=A0AAD1Y972_EUPCR|nr:unnamed protein product [Moneuplotes crassus]
MTMDYRVKLNLRKMTLQSRLLKIISGAKQIEKVHSLQEVLLIAPAWIAQTIKLSDSNPCLKLTIINQGNSLQARRASFRYQESPVKPLQKIPPFVTPSKELFPRMGSNLLSRRCSGFTPVKRSIRDPTKLTSTPIEPVLQRRANSESLPKTRTSHVSVLKRAESLSYRQNSLKKDQSQSKIPQIFKIIRPNSENFPKEKARFQLRLPADEEEKYERFVVTHNPNFHGNKWASKGITGGFQIPQVGSLGAASRFVGFRPDFYGGKHNSVMFNNSILDNKLIYEQSSEEESDPELKDFKIMLKKADERQCSFSKKKYMINRTDVLKKTILRAIRSEYNMDFSKFLKDKSYQKDCTPKEFSSYLDSYAAALIQKHGPGKVKQKYGDLPDLGFTVGLFVDYCKMKKLSFNTESKNLLNEFHEVLYKYSHEKFNKFIHRPCTKFLFSNILTLKSLEKFLQDHQTLGKDKKKYRKCIKDLISCELRT